MYAATASPHFSPTHVSEAKADLEVKIEQIRSGLEVKIEQVGAGVETVKAELQRDMEKVGADLARRMLTGWVAQTGLLAALVRYLFTSGPGG